MTNHATLHGPDWNCVNPRAPWRARDSQGFLVYDEHLWIFGGWFSPDTANPRDVWKSADGARWELVLDEAPWEHGDLPACMAHRGRMWLMGGRKLPGAENSNKVWSSQDGAHWILEGEAGWSPRVCHGYAVFRERMWILGGTENFYDDNDQTLKNDVWSSEDGRAWRLETDAAAWPRRRDAGIAVFRDKLWIMGGGSWHPVKAPRNDVWCSEDGVHWKQIAETAPWKPRSWFSLLVHADRMWLMGGWNSVDGNFADVWCSENGRDWMEVRCDVIWTPRHQPSAYVKDDRIWIAGGHAQPVNSEVWSWRPPSLATASSR